MDEAMVQRAQGCLLGQLSGDSLGSLVEFQSAAEIRAAYPQGVRAMADGGTFHTIAGQPTDDSEMALLLARLLVQQRSYDPAQAFARYRYWLSTEPFDCGSTIRGALTGRLNSASQANGALMRVSPIGIFGATRMLAKVEAMARADAALTHPNPVCGDVNALYAMAIAEAIREGSTPAALYDKIVGWARDRHVEASVERCIHEAAEALPENPSCQQGWVLIAFQNALYQLLHAPSLEGGISDSVMLGGDTDTNAAIAGALLGAVYGRAAVPNAWVECLQQCRPEAGRKGVLRPRPEVLWPVDVLQLAEELVVAKIMHAG